MELLRRQARQPGAQRQRGRTAAWYERQGPAGEVLRVGELPDPEPGPGEVRVRLTMSGVNPGDVKKRQGWLGSAMAYPRVVPHSDGAGVVDAVGPDVDPSLLGRRVWVYGAQSYRPSGTAAEATVVPQGLAVDLPDGVGDELGAALGIPGITAHRAVFADGPVTGRVVLVHGVLGAVGSLAAQLARWDGATVVGTVRRSADLARTPVAAVALDAPDVAGRIRALVPGGVDRIVEVALSANIDLDAEVAAQGAVIAAYSSPAERPSLPFWPLLFANVTLRLLGSDDFPPEAKRQAARDLTAAAAAGALAVPVAATYPLDKIAAAHEAVESGNPPGRVLVAVG
ncbi:MAG: oxidoreductase [Actinobacteria bacterium 13_2_20CM_2_71_6]|nr:MAG: oxidoreductase [Actinobacteria bacterium 13_2_20CM_2_71_6]